QLRLLRRGKGVGLVGRQQILLQRHDRYLRYRRETDLGRRARRIIENGRARQHAGRRVVGALPEFPLAEIGALGAIFVEPAIDDIGRGGALITRHRRRIGPVGRAAGGRVEPASIQESCHIDWSPQVMVRMPLTWSMSTVKVLPLVSVIATP